MAGFNFIKIVKRQFLKVPEDISPEIKLNSNTHDMTPGDPDIG